MIAIRHLDVLYDLFLFPPREIAPPRVRSAGLKEVIVYCSPFFALWLSCCPPRFFFFFFFFFFFLFWSPFRLIWFSSPA